MTVRQLIAQLKKMPQNLQVAIAEQDNSEYEASGWVGRTMLFDKKDFPTHERVSGPENEDMFNSMPKKCVIIRG